MHFNAKALGLIAVAALAAVVVFPDLVRFVPLLLVAACPLSMFLMGGHMGGHASHQAGAAAAGPGEYVCPMHADVRSNGPGRCGKCGMALQLVRVRGAAPDRGPRPEGPQASGSEEIARLEAEMEGLGDRQQSLAREIERIRQRNDLVQPPRALREAEDAARAADGPRDEI